MSEEQFQLQSVNGRWCERSMTDLERAALIYITRETHNHFGDNGLIALLADYIRLGREYSDMMGSDSKNMRDRITELEKANEVLRATCKHGYGFTDEELALINVFRGYGKKKDDQFFKTIMGKS